MVGVKINLGGHEIISTCVFIEEINIQKKGKIVGITMTKIRIKNNNLYINGVFILINL